MLTDFLFLFHLFFYFNFFFRSGLAFEKSVSKCNQSFICEVEVRRAFHLRSPRSKASPGLARPRQASASIMLFCATPIDAITRHTLFSAGEIGHQRVKQQFTSSTLPTRRIRRSFQSTSNLALLTQHGLKTG